MGWEHARRLPYYRILIQGKGRQEGYPTYVYAEYVGQSCRSFLPLFCSRGLSYVIACFHPCLFSCTFYRSILIYLQLGRSFPSWCFGGDWSLKAEQGTISLTFWGSQNRGVLSSKCHRWGTWLPSKFPLFNERSLHFYLNVPHDLILLCSLDPGTACVGHMHAYSPER